MMRKSVVLLAGVVGLTFAAFGVDVMPMSLTNAVKVSVDPTVEPIKDLRQLKAGAGFGFNSFLGEFAHANAEWYYTVDKENTARAFAESGTRIVRNQDAMIHFQGERAERVRFATTYRNFDWGRSALNMKNKWRSTDQKNVFDFFMQYKMKVILCLNGAVYDQEKDAITADVEKVEKVALDYLKWIRDNGYADCVIGVELENEPYFGPKPDSFACRWNRIVPKMRALWPDLAIGLPISIYQQNDPDLEAVRQRGQLKDALEGPAHTAAHVNQWTGNAITSLTAETLSNITHIVIHTYGANGSYTANYGGIVTARRMRKIYPEIDGKPFWITEWRDRSDEDHVCHRRFVTTLWKAQYLQMVVAQPDVDATFLHSNGTSAGNLYQSNGKTWVLQMDEKMNRGGLRDTTGNGQWRLDVGTAGPLYRVFLNALDQHPLVIAHGDELGFGFSANTRMYDADVARYLARRSGKPMPPRKTDLTWLVAAHPKWKSVAFLFVNTHPDEREVELAVAGYDFGDSCVHRITCEKGLERALEVPGEPKPWKVASYQMSLGPKVTVPGNSILVLETGLRKPKVAEAKRNPDLPD